VSGQGPLLSAQNCQCLLLRHLELIQLVVAGIAVAIVLYMRLQQLEAQLKELTFEMWHCQRNNLRQEYSWLAVLYNKVIREIQVFYTK